MAWKKKTKHGSNETRVSARSDHCKLRVQFILFEVFEGLHSRAKIKYKNTFEIQIKREFKRKQKQKRNGWGHLRGGASRPSRRLPRLRFCFRFRLNLRLIWISKRVAVKWLEKKLDLNSDSTLDLTLNFWSDLRNIETLTGFSRFLTTCLECMTLWI